MLMSNKPSCLESIQFIILFIYFPQMLSFPPWMTVHSNNNYYYLFLFFFANRQCPIVKLESGRDLELFSVYHRCVSERARVRLNTTAVYGTHRAQLHLLRHLSFSGTFSREQPKLTMAKTSQIFHLR